MCIVRFQLPQAVFQIICLVWCESKWAFPEHGVLVAGGSKSVTSRDAGRYANFYMHHMFRKSSSDEGGFIVMRAPQVWGIG